MTRRLRIALALLAVAVGVLLYLGWQRRSSGLPRQGTQAYEQTTRAFYSGVAALQVGLLDDAVRYFEEATRLAPREPAAWGNLAVTRLRLSDVEAAEPAVNDALRLAEDTAAVQMLAARWEIARGNLDAGIVRLRRAIELDPDHLRARFALAEELERAGTPAQATEALTLLDDAVRRAPNNVALMLERARMAAARQNATSLADAVSRLQSASTAWAPLARTQLEALQASAGSGDVAQTSRAVLMLRNALARDTSFAADLAAVRTPPETIADAFDTFLRLPQPEATPAAPDLSVRFATEDLDPRPATATLAMTLDVTGPPVVFAADAASIWRTGDPDTALPFPGAGVAPGPQGLLGLDWNNDFATDLLAAGNGGIRLFVQTDGRFEDRTAQAGAKTPVNCACRAAWSADLEMDGDLDVVLGVVNGPTQVLRNNGDGMWTPLGVFAATSDVRAFAWADLDADGDPDAVLQSPRVLRIFMNDRAGAFTAAASVPMTDSLAMTVADLDADGRFDILTSNADGTVMRSSLRPSGQWETVTMTTPDGPAAQPADRSAGAKAETTLLVGDLDNNGALDVIRSGVRTSIWLADERHALRALPVNSAAHVSQLIDLNDDGRLDLLGASGRAQRLLTTGDKTYHWKQFRVRAQPVAGDQRINPFAVGGEIDVRAGLLRQRQLLAGTPTHFGLGTHTTVDVARIVWPNGAPQVEFASAADGTIVAEQRLKGSCPWVFAHDGTDMKFVTDFIWRSPLGLRINAQDTAGVSQTEDWVRLRGDQLAPHDGHYEVRITAELWETHFFDHVSLMVVDHPSDRDMVIDERFTPQPVSFAVTTVRDALPVLNAADDRGGDVTAVVARRDGRHLATFQRGHYQGIAQDHAVAFDLPARTEPGSGERLVLVAQGWVYPTDSSINVAVGQGTRQGPYALSLEYQAADGRWVVATPNLGFPAGKNKTMVIDLRPVGRARRVRLRTNMEVYWDALATAIVTNAPVRTQRLTASTADLRYRGFSRTSSLRDHAPETPSYTPVAATGQRWRDLVGFYTRFGDVRELIAGVDDRYVIMNAGDELALRFPVPPAQPQGWTRDFVLIGDGWEKDGDYNTEHSSTVLPLPTHKKTGLGTRGAGLDDQRDRRVASSAPATPAELEDDPVYQRHREDWARYHTRHVRPDVFAKGLMTGTNR